VAICRAEAFEDSPAHALGARALRGEECLRVEIFGDDRCHATGLDAARADGGARPAHRRLIGGHGARRPGQAGQAHAREATTAQIVIRAIVAPIDPRLHVLRQLHCLVSLLRNSSGGHGFSISTGSGLLKSSLVPSGKVMLVTGLPVAFSACAIILLMLGRRGLPGWRGLRWGFRSASSSRSLAARCSSAAAAHSSRSSGLLRHSTASSARKRSKANSMV